MDDPCKVCQKFLDIAKKEVGIHETPGPQATKRIVEYDATTSLKATSDEVPWCSSFANWVVTQAGLKGTNSAAADSWSNWGAEVPDGDQCPGCVVVLSRVGGHHVGFYSDEDDDGVFLLGGNQSDKVCIRHFSWDVVQHIRWPV
jgi:uncharacterized protein (TIGR02594 family)